MPPEGLRKMVVILQHMNPKVGLLESVKRRSDLAETGKHEDWDYFKVAASDLTATGRGTNQREGRNSVGHLAGLFQRGSKAVGYDRIILHDFGIG